MKEIDPAVALQRSLFGAFKAIRNQLSRELEVHGVHGGQEYMLEQLWREDGLSVGELAERIGIEVPTVVRTVKRMEAAGLLQRRPDPGDRRRALIVLTDRGRELERVVPDLLAELDRRATATLSEDERAELLRMLDEVWTNVRAGRSGESC